MAGLVVATAVPEDRDGGTLAILAGWIRAKGMDEAGADP